MNRIVGWRSAQGEQKVFAKHNTVTGCESQQDRVYGDKSRGEETRTTVCELEVDLVSLKANRVVVSLAVPRESANGRTRGGIKWS